MKPATGSRRAAYFWLGIFLVCCLLLVALGVYGYVDAKTGTAGTSHITYCETTHISSRQSSVSCKGRWTVDDHRVTGWVDNANYKDLGHDISVQIHGGRATEVHLWMPIVILLFGLTMTAFTVWALVRVPRRFPPAPRTD